MINIYICSKQWCIMQGVTLDNAPFRSMIGSFQISAHNQLIRILCTFYKDESSRLMKSGSVSAIFMHLKKKLTFGMLMVHLITSIS